MEFKSRDHLASIPHRRRAKTIEEKFADLRRPKRFELNNTRYPTSDRYRYLAWKDWLKRLLFILLLAWVIYILYCAYNVSWSPHPKVLMCKRAVNSIERERDACRAELAALIQSIAPAGVTIITAPEIKTEWVTSWVTQYAR
jgi:hypothetical protein